MKRLLSFSVFCSAIAIAPLAHSTMVVIPSDFATEEGSSISGDGTALGAFTNTVHTVYNESVLLAAGLSAGDVLNGLSFRVNAENAAPNFSVANYTIRLSTSNNSAGNLADSFAANRGAGFTTVRSGALEFNAADYDASSDPNGTPVIPNAFGPVITFDNTFTYTGGDLLLEYTHTAPEALNRSLATSRADAVIEFNDDDDNPLVETLFGMGFDASERFTGFAAAPGFAPVVQFSVVPEPSTGILGGMGFLGLLLRRRR